MLFRQGRTGETVGYDRCESPVLHRGLRMLACVADPNLVRVSYRTRGAPLAETHGGGRYRLGHQPVISKKGEGSMYSQAHINLAVMTKVQAEPGECGLQGIR